MLHSLDLVGTFAFALSGALLAARKRMDVFGVVVLAIAAGLGGGIARDVLIGRRRPLQSNTGRTSRRRRPRA